MIIYSPTFTGSVQITGSQLVTGDLTVQGNLTAQTFILSSSVSYFTESFASGSTRFGDSMDDTMKVTGSLLLTGSVGIGTASPSTLLHLSGIDSTLTLQGTRGTGGTHTIGASGANNTNLSIVASSGMYLTTNGADRLVINSSGNVGIGTSSPQNLLHIKAGSSGLASYDARYKSIIENNGEAYYVVTVPDNSYAGLRILGTSTGTKGGFEYYMTDDNLLIFSAGYQRFFANGSERMRITSGGRVFIGTTSSSGSERFVVYNDVSSASSAKFQNNCSTGESYGPIILAGTNASDASLRVINQAGTSTYFTVRGDGVLIAPVTYNIDITSGRTLVVRNDGVIGYIPSTLKAKTNVSSIENVDWIYNLNPVNFNYRKKDDENNYTDEFYEQKEYGLIAEEVAQVNEDFVFYDTKEDGSIDLKGVHYDKLIPVLVKAIQELKSQNDSLQQQINELKA